MLEVLREKHVRERRIAERVRRLLEVVAARKEERRIDGRARWCLRKEDECHWEASCREGGRRW